MDATLELAKRFLGFLGSSVAAISTAFYVAGFLAIQARHAILGISDLPVDLRQYLFGGGVFFAYFPQLVVHLFGGLAGGMSKLLIYMADDTSLAYRVLVLIAVLLLFLVALLYPPARLRVQRVGAILARAAARRQTGLYILLAFILLLAFVIGSAKWLREASDLLYRPANARPAVLVDSVRGEERETSFAILTAIALAGVLGFLNLLGMNSSAQPPTLVTRAARAFAAVCVLLHIVYLPINFGILVLSNEYPILELELDPSNGKDASQSSRFALLHRYGDEYFLYSPESQAVFQIARGELTRLKRIRNANIFDLGSFGPGVAPTDTP